MVLEEVYGIDDLDICHIHNSIKDGEVILGHGNYEKKREAKLNKIEAQELYEDKVSAIYSVLSDYYEKTEKETSRIIFLNKNFFNKLQNVEQVTIIGHSLGSVDIPYFNEIVKQAPKIKQWRIVDLNYNDYLYKASILKPIIAPTSSIEFIESNNFFDL